MEPETNKIRKAFIWFLVLLLVALAFTVYLYYRPSPRKGRQKKPPVASQSVTVQVLRIKDGDTIEVNHEGIKEDVRLWGIDAPEKTKDQPFAAEATQALSDLVADREVILQHPPQGPGKDRYGRTLSIVFIGKKNVNLALVQAGAAWWYAEYAPKETALEKAEAEAKGKKLGLWKDARSTPPWEWRRESR